jgi:hypothetical protein
MKEDSKQVQHFKNGASPKSLMSTGIQMKNLIKTLIIIMSVLLNASCNHDEEDIFNPPKEEPKEKPIDNTIRFTEEIEEFLVSSFTEHNDKFELFMTKKKIKITNPNREIGADTIQLLTDSVNKKYYEPIQYNNKDRLRNDHLFKLKINGQYHELREWNGVNSIVLFNPLGDGTPLSDDIIKKYTSTGTDSLIRFILSDRHLNSGFISSQFGRDELALELSYQGINDEIQAWCSFSIAIPLTAIEYSSSGINDQAKLWLPRFEGRTFKSDGVTFTMKLVNKKLSEVEGWDHSMNFLAKFNSNTVYPIVQLYAGDDLYYEGVLTGQSNWYYKDIRYGDVREQDWACNRYEDGKVLWYRFWGEGRIDMQTNVMKDGEIVDYHIEQLKFDPADTNGKPYFYVDDSMYWLY